MKKNDVSEYVTSMNIEGMKFLKIGNLATAQKMLQNASKALASHPSLSNLHTITLNNLGCYYKSVKKPKLALKYLEQSIELQKTGIYDPLTLSGTYLNISSLHSDLENYNFALEYSTKAMSLLVQSDANDEKHLTALAMAYHSLAITNSHLNNYKIAFEQFELALSNAKKIPTALNLQNFIENSMKNVENKTKSENNSEVSVFKGKKLPFVRKNERIFTSPMQNFQVTRQRFLTGDRLKPMFGNNNENPQISKTLAKIQEKIEFLQTRLKNFQSCEAEFKSLKENNDLSDSFSTSSLEDLRIFHQRNQAAQKIQKVFRKTLTKKPQNMIKLL